MERETKLQMDAIRGRIEELNEAAKEYLKLRDQVAAMRKALSTLATALERLPIAGNGGSAADLGALRDACKQLRRL